MKLRVHKAGLRDWEVYATDGRWWTVHRRANGEWVIMTGHAMREVLETGKRGKAIIAAIAATIKEAA